MSSHRITEHIGAQEFSIDHQKYQMDKFSIRSHTLSHSNQNNQSFLKKFNDHNSKVIKETYQQIVGMMKHLDDIHCVLLENQQKEFMTSYKEHMSKVQCEILIMKHKSTKEYAKMKMDERVRYLEDRITFLRTEMGSLVSRIDNLSKQSEILQEKLTKEQETKEFLKQYTIATKKQNQMLMQTIEKLKDPEIQYKYKRRLQILNNQRASFLVTERAPQDKTTSLLKSKQIIPSGNQKQANTSGLLKLAHNSPNQASQTSFDFIKSTAPDTLSINESKFRLNLRNQQNAIIANNSNNELTQTLSNLKMNDTIQNNSHTALNNFRARRLSETFDCENDKVLKHLGDQDKRIVILESQLSFEQKRNDKLKQKMKKDLLSQSSTNIGNLEMQEIFLDCIKTIKQCAVKNQGMKYLTIEDRHRIIFDLLKDNKVLVKLYDLLFGQKQQSAASISIIDSQEYIDQVSNKNMQIFSQFNESSTQRLNMSNIQISDQTKSQIDEDPHNMMALSTKSFHQRTASAKNSIRSMIRPVQNIRKQFKIRDGKLLVNNYAN
ncbi:UNKNOWN [Stylonychia lemnae]|uniref:Uncharacterized protein n=1 Tax=Stylonychia lemnae TaxID=5949 RepID=A0A078B3U5_STYLE|nr:UNKNOWN [Stylonychia lemnae]|eukprot:CDW88891.1 UNKNOWN [Stylonychia lemnae]